MPRTPHPYIDSRFEQQLEMVRPSRERADVSALPAGYTLRPFRDGDESAYTELFRLACHLSQGVRVRLVSSKTAVVPGSSGGVSIAPALLSSCRKRAAAGASGWS